MYNEIEFSQEVNIQKNNKKIKKIKYLETDDSSEYDQSDDTHNPFFFITIEKSNITKYKKNLKINIILD